MNGYQPERRTLPYTPNIVDVRKVAEQFLTELSSQGVDANGRSAHWWVGCLSSQLEYFLAATEPKPRKTDEEREQAEAQARLMAAEMTPGRRSRRAGAK